jgi:hypothetical protein
MTLGLGQDFEYSLTAVDYNQTYSSEERAAAAISGGMSITPKGSISGSAEAYTDAVRDFIPFTPISVATVDPKRVRGANPR